ncbi:MAG: succinate dehydrogenase, cytochrome b556 subunit [Tabrizicola sp.]|nr:succinate dehydrogenase, cytochrome b556 subunit [Tabrizicola sp.]MBL9053760.1 succinate dehydrogenase, cytochrome b556 subunit [Tabrizicola sp.]HMS96232.1 succinate dehydrogenase, cytochrome b556 subunit [Tabrizicola sp.]
MAKADEDKRPLSPFMIGPYYRPQMTSMSSILIRITGLALIAGIALTVAWLVAAAVSEDWFACVDWIVTSWIGKLVYVGSTWAVWYHLLGGVRHFIFDAGRAMDIPTAEKLGWAMIVGSVALTVITILVASL